MAEILPNSKYRLDALSMDDINLIATDAFKIADKDSNGYIDMDEFCLCVKNVMDFFGTSNSANEIKTEFDRIDTDKNGIIDFDEFKIFVKEIIKQMLSL